VPTVRSAGKFGAERGLLVEDGVAMAAAGDQSRLMQGG
jgi:hypothetical protein